MLKRLLIAIIAGCGLSVLLQAQSIFPPTNATFLLQVANAALPNAFAIGADPNADRIVFWDDSAGGFKYLTAGSGLTITDTTITASGFDTSACTNGWVLYKSSGDPCSRALSFVGSTSQQLILGTPYPSALSFSRNALVVGANETTGDSALIAMMSNGNITDHPLFTSYSSNGTQATPTANVDDQRLFDLSMSGYSGSDFSEAVRLRATVDGTPDSLNNVVPGKFTIFVQGLVGGATYLYTVDALTAPNVVVSTATGTGTQFACFDANGKLVRSALACGT